MSNKKINIITWILIVFITLLFALPLIIPAYLCDLENEIKIFMLVFGYLFLSVPLITMIIIFIEDKIIPIFSKDDWYD